VLVGDDNPVHRYFTSRVLRAVGYEVREPPSVGDAMRCAPGVAAVILDVGLPSLDGWEVCRRLRAAAPISTLPVLHYSALLAALRRGRGPRK